MRYISNTTAVCALLVAICGVHTANAGETNVVTHGSTYASVDSWNDTDTELFQLGGGRLTLDNYSYHSKDIVFTGICGHGAPGTTLKLTGSHKKRVIIPGCD